MAIQIKKAVRERVWLKLAITGPTGSGKTWGAIAMAKGLAPNGKVLVIDTENRSASYYAGRWDFDVVELDAPFTTQKYNEGLQAALQNGYEVVVIDSLTHEWAASGGILDQKAAKDSRGGNSFTNWGEMKSLHNKFVETLLQSKIHVLATMRSKMEYVLEENDKGKQTPRKVGLAPISSDGVEYEFGVVFDVDRNSHLAIASKDRTSLFEGRNINLDETVGRELALWLAAGAELAPVPPNTPAPIQPKPTTAPAAQGSQSEPTHTDPPAEWVSAMVDLTEVTLGMPDQTRAKLIATWEGEGPQALPELLKEIANIRSTMAPPSAGAVIGALPPPEKAPVSKEASDFVDSLDPDPAPVPPADTDEASGGINAEQYQALGTLLQAFAINRDAYRSYCFKAGHLLPGKNGPTLARFKAEEFTRLRDKLCNKKIAAGKETWSQRTVRIINATPVTTFQPIAAAS
jgi:hypothetical protein